MTHNPPDLINPDWIPSDEEELEILASVARAVAWEKPMAAQGSKVLSLRLTPDERKARIDAWARDHLLGQSPSIER